MEEIFDSIHTKKDCDSFIEEIKSKLKQLEGKQLRIEVFSTDMLIHNRNVANR